MIRYLPFPGPPAPAPSPRRRLATTGPEFLPRRRPPPSVDDEDDFAPVRRARQIHAAPHFLARRRFPWGDDEAELEPTRHRSAVSIPAPVVVAGPWLGRRRTSENPETEIFELLVPHRTASLYPAPSRVQPVPDDGWVAGARPYGWVAGTRPYGWVAGNH
jgi:hypothetical protein